MQSADVRAHAQEAARNSIGNPLEMGGTGHEKQYKMDRTPRAVGKALSQEPVFACRPDFLPAGATSKIKHLGR